MPQEQFQPEPLRRQLVLLEQFQPELLRRQPVLLELPLPELLLQVVQSTSSSQ